MQRNFLPFLSFKNGKDGYQTKVRTFNIQKYEQELSTLRKKQKLSTLKNKSKNLQPL
jgi:hypothetical protein